MEVGFLRPASHPLVEPGDALSAFAANRIFAGETLFTSFPVQKRVLELLDYRLPESARKELQPPAF